MGRQTGIRLSRSGYPQCGDLISVPTSEGNRERRRPLEFLQLFLALNPSMDGPRYRQQIEVDAGRTLQNPAPNPKCQKMPVHDHPPIAANSPSLPKRNRISHGWMRQNLPMIGHVAGEGESLKLIPLYIKSTPWTPAVPRLLAYQIVLVLMFYQYQC